METLEFIDYLFDRYAYLDIDPAAPAETIRQEVRRRRAENHPDKLHNISVEILATAARTTALIDSCARVLMDAELRPLYDVKLAHFKETAPHLVSVSGTPIHDPSRFRIDLDYLMHDEVTDIGHLEAYAASMSGHDDKRVARARSGALPLTQSRPRWVLTRACTLNRAC